MCLPASIACVSRSARICVVPASKKTVSSGFGERGVEIGGRALDAVLRGERRDLLGVAADQDRVGHHAVAVRRARRRPGRGSRRIERTRCWLSPMRPVTPCMMMPRRCVATIDPPELVRGDRYNTRRLAVRPGACPQARVGRRFRSQSRVVEGGRKRTPAGRVRGPVAPDARGGGIVIRHGNNDRARHRFQGRRKNSRVVIPARSPRRFRTRGRRLQP